MKNVLKGIRANLTMSHSWVTPREEQRASPGPHGLPAWARPVAPRALPTTVPLQTQCPPPRALALSSLCLKPSSATAVTISPVSLPLIHRGGVMSESSLGQLSLYYLNC
jgi:hypothetical protein